MNAAQNLPDLETIMKERLVPGLSLVFMEDAKVTFQKNLGLKNSQKKDPVDDNTLFEAASLSKPVFTYGVLKLVEKGTLDLDRPLVNYLLFSDIKDDKRVNFITARMVLTHTSGLPNWRPKNEALMIYFEPGARFNYSGEGFLYLQKVIEHISGLSLEEYMQKNIFVPLNMPHSSFVWSYDGQKAKGHDIEGNPIEMRDEVPQNAAFTLHTTALDYAKFITAILNDNSKTIHEMLRPHIKLPITGSDSILYNSCKLSDTLSWGLGWGIQSINQTDSFWHWGDNGGFKSFILASKNNNSAIIIFTNSSNGLLLISDIINKFKGFSQTAFEWIKKG